MNEAAKKGALKQAWSCSSCSWEEADLIEIATTNSPATDLPADELSRMQKDKVAAEVIAGTRRTTL